MKKLAFYPIVALLITLPFFNSCDSEDTITPSEGIVTEVNIEDATDDVFVDDIFEEVDVTAETELFSLNKVGFDNLSLEYNTELKSDDVGVYVCKVVTVDHPDSTTFPKVVTIDYGEGCSIIVNDDTITKSGKIIITITQPLFIPGAQRIITFEDYYVNGIRIEGTRTVTFDNINAENMLIYQIRLENGKLTFPDSTCYTRTTERTRAWERAANPLDDVVWLTGWVEGTNRRELQYRHEILERLMIMRCAEARYKWTIVDGVIECTVGEESWTIDYGSGDCDDTATLTREGESQQIRVRSRYRTRTRTNN